MPATAVKLLLCTDCNVNPPSPFQEEPLYTSNLSETELNLKSPASSVPNIPVLCGSFITPLGGDTNNFPSVPIVISFNSSSDIIANWIRLPFPSPVAGLVVSAYILITFPYWLSNVLI